MMKKLKSPGAGLIHVHFSSTSSHPISPYQNLTMGQIGCLVHFEILILLTNQTTNNPPLKKKLRTTI